MSYDKAFKRVLTATRTGDLRQYKDGIAGADVICALGMSDKLGAALYRVYAEMDVGSLKEAVSLLTQRLMRGGEQVSVYRQIAHIVLREHVANVCLACNGTGVRPTRDGVRRSCGACKGSGRSRPNNASRRKELGMTAAQFAPLVSVFERGHRLVSQAEYDVGKGVSKRLGMRGGGGARPS